MKGKQNIVFGYDIPKMVIPESEIKKEKAKEEAKEKRLEKAKERLMLKEQAKLEKQKQKELQKASLELVSEPTEKKEKSMMEEVKPSSHVCYSILLALFFAITLACCLLGAMPVDYTLMGLIGGSWSTIVNNYTDLVQRIFSATIITDYLTYGFSALISLLGDICYVITVIGSFVGFLASLIKIKKHKKNMAKSLFIVISAFLGMLVARLAAQPTYELVSVSLILNAVQNLGENYRLILLLAFMVFALLAIIQNTATSKFRETRFIAIRKRNSALGYTAFATVISFVLVVLVCNPIVAVQSLIEEVFNLIGTKTFNLSLVYTAGAWIGFIGMAPSAHKLIKVGICKPYKECELKKSVVKASRLLFIFTTIFVASAVVPVILSGSFDIISLIPVAVPVPLTLGVLFSAPKAKRNCVQVD